VCSHCFYGRRHCSSHEHERSTTHRFGISLHVCSSLRFTTSTAAPLVACSTTINREDYQINWLDSKQHPTIYHALLLDFGEHRVIRYAIHSIEPERSFNRNVLNRLLQPEGPNQLLFHGVALNPRNAIFVKVLCLKDQLPGMSAQLADLSDKEREVVVRVTGQISEGEIKEYIPTPPRITPGRVKTGSPDSSYCLRLDCEQSSVRDHEFEQFSDSTNL
jgi:hypothetical protein